MKSSKLKATLAAVSAIAVMASASTSFAAATVTTKSTYNASSDKVSVEATVSDLEANKEVTYLVTGDSDNIVYIDQATLDGSGAATFSYKIDKTKIKNLTTKVTYGTDGNISAPKEADGLGFGNVTANAENATIKYYTDSDCKNEISGSIVAGKNETIYAKVEANAGYEITGITIGDQTADLSKSVHELTAGQTITVTTEETVVTPVITPSTPVVDTDLVGTEIEVGENKKTVKASVTTVLKITKAEEFDEYGVIFDGVAYPAINTGNNANVAVRILTTDDTEISKDAVRPYYKKSGVYYYADDNTEIK